MPPKTQPFTIFTTHYRPPFGRVPDELTNPEIPDRQAFKMIEEWCLSRGKEQAVEWLVAMAEATHKATSLEELQKVITDLLHWLLEYVDPHIEI
jgi:hypothetical protein